MRDFTLLIPSYNRPRLLRALLYYLRSTTPGLKFLVLDSSDDKTLVRQIVADIHRIEYPSNTHPFDKFFDGAKRVATAYCQICADDDIIFVDGVEKCLDALKANPLASCAKGAAFSFTWNPEKADEMHLADGYQRPPAFDQPTPLERVAALMGSYVAMVYAVWPADRLRWALKAAAEMKSLLAKELLLANMAAVAGPILSIDKLSHGRSMGNPVFPYRQWHPLEFFANQAPELGREYMDYRNRLMYAILGNFSMPPEALGRALDIIHLRYLAQHCPRDVMDYVVDRKARGIQPEGYLSPDMQKSLLNASLSNMTVGLTPEAMQTIFDAMKSYMWGLTPVSEDPQKARQAAREARGAVGEAWSQLDAPAP